MLLLARNKIERHPAVISYLDCPAAYRCDLQTVLRLLYRKISRTAQRVFSNDYLRIKIVLAFNTMQGQVATHLARNKLSLNLVVAIFVLSKTISGNEAASKTS